MRKGPLPPAEGDAEPGVVGGACVDGAVDGAWVPLGPVVGAKAGVVTMVVRQAVLLAVTGLAIGLALALGASRLIEGLLFGTEPGDPLTYTAVAAGLVCVAIAASYLPARRASRIDPMRALRFD